MKNSKVFLFLLGLVFFGSCVSPKKILYFQNDKIDQSKVSNDYVTFFKPDDLLLITVSGSDLASVQPFNLPVASFGAATTDVIGQPRQIGYLVDRNGNIEFPVLGTLKIGGLTRENGIKMIKEKLADGYVKDPIVNIRIMNFKVTVLGDVARPGSYTIPNERITVLEAIALAGDLNISGVRNTVTVTREEDNKKNVYTVDLLSNKLYTSPVFYLQQNDVIYVQQSNGKLQGAASNPNAGLFISIASVIISLITLAIR